MNVTGLEYLQSLSTSPKTLSPSQIRLFPSLHLLFPFIYKYSTSIMGLPQTSKTKSSRTSSTKTRKKAGPGPTNPSHPIRKGKRKKLPILWAGLIVHEPKELESSHHQVPPHSSSRAEPSGGAGQVLRGKNLQNSVFFSALPKKCSIFTKTLLATYLLSQPTNLTALPHSPKTHLGLPGNPSESVERRSRSKVTGMTSGWSGWFKTLEPRPERATGDNFPTSRLPVYLFNRKHINKNNSETHQKTKPSILPYTIYTLNHPKALLSSLGPNKGAQDLRGLSSDDDCRVVHTPRARPPGVGYPAWPKEGITRKIPKALPPSGFTSFLSR